MSTTVRITVNRSSTRKGEGSAGRAGKGGEGSGEGEGEPGGAESPGPLRPPNGRRSGEAPVQTLFHVGKKLRRDERTLMIAARSSCQPATRRAGAAARSRCRVRRRRGPRRCPPR